MCMIFTFRATAAYALLLIMECLRIPYWCFNCLYVSVSPRIKIKFVCEKCGRIITSEGLLSLYGNKTPA